MLPCRCDEGSTRSQRKRRNMYRQHFRGSRKRRSREVPPRPADLFYPTPHETGPYIPVDTAPRPSVVGAKDLRGGIGRLAKYGLWIAFRGCVFAIILAIFIFLFG